MRRQQMQLREHLFKLGRQRLSVVVARHVGKIRLSAVGRQLGNVGNRASRASYPPALTSLTVSAMVPNPGAIAALRSLAESSNGDSASPICRAPHKHDSSVG